MTKSGSCVIFLLIGALVIVALAYCGYRFYAKYNREMPLIETAADSWLDHYNHDQFSECYKAADPLMTTGNDEAAFNDKIRKLKEQFGEIRLGSRTNTNLRDINGTETSTCQWNATNAKMKRVVVIFNFHLSDKWRVSGFQVQASL